MKTQPDNRKENAMTNTPENQCEMWFDDMYPEFAPDPIVCGAVAATRVHYFNRQWGEQDYMDVCASHANQIRIELVRLSSLTS